VSVCSLRRWYAFDGKLMLLLLLLSDDWLSPNYKESGFVVWSNGMTNQARGCQVGLYTIALLLLQIHVKSYAMTYLAVPCMG